MEVTTMKSPYPAKKCLYLNVAIHMSSLLEFTRLSLGNTGNLKKYMVNWKICVNEWKMVSLEFGKRMHKE